MKDCRFQFPLRFLLIAVAILSALIAAAVNQPGFALVFAAVTLPFLWSGVVAHIIRTPRFARLIMALCSIAVVLASGQLFILANRNNAMDLRGLFSLAILCGYGLMCGLAAWLIPNEVP